MVIQSNCYSSSNYGPIRGVNKYIPDTCISPYMFSTINNQNENNFDSRDLIINHLLQTVHDLKTKHDEQQRQINDLLLMVNPITTNHTNIFNHDFSQSNNEIDFFNVPFPIINCNNFALSSQASHDYFNHINNDTPIVDSTFPFTLPQFTIPMLQNNNNQNSNINYVFNSTMSNMFQ